MRRRHSELLKVCGIAGFAADAGGVEARAKILLGALAHRGPDGGWWETVDGWCLVQTRLAIVDLSDRVRYPMRAETDRLRLLFNGEIYNHEALRHQLERRGHRFATHCDAEVVVHGYEEWGTDVFERLNGMWAIVLLDRASGELLLARDAMGIKPLVRTTSAPFCFGSDAIALVGAGLVRGDIDLEAISEFAAFHYVPEPLTGIRGIEHVPPGTVLRRGPDGREHSERWAAPLFSASAATEPVTIEAADATLRAAVERQLKADVDVGVFLSGGIDSALVLQYAVDVGARPTAFTIGFEGFGDYDETPSAREMTARLGVPHHVEMLDVGFVDAISGIRAAYDTPFGDSSAIATLPLARLARRHVTVALSGTGGDDLFGGYYRHRAHLLRRALSLVPQPMLRRVAAADPQRGSEHARLSRTLRSYAIRLAGAGAGGPREYLRLVGSSTSAKALCVFRQPVDLAVASAAVGRRHGLTPETVIDLDTIQNFELATYLAGDLLVKEDRATMAHSLESRVPLLDVHVGQLAAATPQEQRATLRGGKRLLRSVARHRLPARRGRKHGFAVPLQALLDGPWAADVDDWLRGKDSALIDRHAAADLVAQRSAFAADVWAICALAAWEERVAEAKTAAAAAGAAMSAG